MTARRATAGQRGFDCNCPLTALHAVAMRAHGFDFVLRYLPRATDPAPSDLSAEEVKRLRAAGLALMPVQHVESEVSWEPTALKGTTYGRNAARICVTIGLAPGTTVWLDLEGVNPQTPRAVIVEYCNNWHKEVHAAGFLPGLYVGWRSGLDAHALFYLLRFTRYWAAYNLNRDEYPERRGVCMRQRVPKFGEIAPGCSDLSYDVNEVLTDLLGDVPMMDTPGDR